MSAITRRRRRAGTIRAQCLQIIEVDNLIPLTIPPICITISLGGFMEYEDGGTMIYEDTGFMEFENPQ